MRPSPLRHPLAQLRKQIGILQKELAAFVDRSPRTIQSIELLKAPLTQNLAESISRQTGVHPDWLMGKRISATPIDIHGNPYTKATYVMTRRSIEGGEVHVDDVIPMAKRFRKVLENAVDAPNPEEQLWRINKALHLLERETEYSWQDKDPRTH